MYAFQGNTWNSLGALTALTVNNGVVTSASFANALSVLDVQYREAEMNSDTYDLRGKWTGDGWDLSGNVGLSKADGGTKRQVFLEFLNWADYTVDISGAPGTPGQLTYAANVQGNPAAFTTDPGWSGNLVTKPTEDEEKYAQADFGMDLDGVIKRVQVGYKFRRHETSQQYAGIAITGVAAGAGLFAPSAAPGNYLNGFGANDQMRGRFRIDGNSMVDYVQSGAWLPAGGAPPTPSIFAAPEFTAGNWAIQEDINAVYAQAPLLLSLAVQSLPIVGDLYSVLTGTIGYDPIAGIRLSDAERALAIGSAAVIGGGFHLLTRLGGVPVPNKITYAVLAYLFIYIASIVVLSFVLIASGLDVFTAFSAVVATINNTGPGLNQVGPATTYAVLTDFQTWVCSFSMLLGRLELFTLLVVLTPAFWRR